MASATLEIQMLGTFLIRAGDRIIPDDAWKLRKAAGIVKLLALEPGHRLHREQILDALWPDLDPDAAANNFRYALHTARQILNAGGRPYREGPYLSLGDPESVWVDVHAFEADLDLAWRTDDPATFQAAVDLYAGDMLPGDIYEDWAETRRTALRTSYLAALGRLARLLEGRGNGGAAIAAWQRLLATDPAAEEAHVQIMLLHARAGRRREALHQYERLVRAMGDELGVEPDPLAQELARAIDSGELAGTVGASTVGDTEPRSSVPTPATGIIGREREIGELQQALVQSRLVTVTGPGGSGKTRLAIEVVRHLEAPLAGGVHFVPLAPISDAGMVATATLQAVGISGANGKSPADALAGALSDRPVLLVLDNFEHVLPAATLVSTLLEQCPTLRVLTTSRTPLRLRGEREFPLRPLPVEASTALFIERSNAVRPGFNPDSDQLPAIAGICRKLDGLPLAIELAAARSRVLSPGALLERLERPLALLSGGPRDLPDRQQTLRATIAWSYDLLPSGLQAYFRALSTFSGGWTLDAAGAVCPDGLDPLDGVTALAESSLIEQQPGDGEPRFQMLETIREFGMERLEEGGEAETARCQHAGYFLSLALQAAPEFRGPRNARAHLTVAQDHDNLRTALTWALEHDPDHALHVASKLEKYWLTRGAFTEWEYWLSAALERSSGASQHDRINAMQQLAFTALEQSDPERSRTLLDEALPLAEALDMQEVLGRIKNLMAYLKEREKDFDAARTLAYESLAHYRQTGVPLAIANELSTIAGLEYNAGNYELAATMMEEALEGQRAAGDTFFVSLGLSNLAVVLHRCGRLDESLQRVDEAMELAGSIGAGNIISGGLILKANFALDQEQYNLAHRLLVEGIEKTIQIGATGRLLNALQAGASVLVVQGKPWIAASTFAAVEHLGQTVRAPDQDHFGPMYEHHRDLCRSLLAPAEWAEACEHGTRLSLAETARTVLDELKALLPDSGEPAGSM